MRFESFVSGDVTRDGVLDVADLIRAINIILSMGDAPTEAERRAVDINNDGTLDVRDLIGMINVILGI